MNIKEAFKPNPVHFNKIKAGTIFKFHEAYFIKNTVGGDTEKCTATFIDSGYFVNFKKDDLVHPVDCTLTINGYIGA